MLHKGFSSVFIFVKIKIPKINYQRKVATKKEIYFKNEKMHSNEESMNSSTVTMYPQECMHYCHIYTSYIYTAYAKRF